MNASATLRAPWRTATPQMPALLAVSPAFDAPLGSHFPAHGLSVRDPFHWKLGHGSFTPHHTKLFPEERKREALATCARLCDTVPFGVFVSSVAEVELAACSQAAFLYVPGEICRQADVLEACVNAGKPVALERGPFLPPSDMVRAFEKLAGLEVLLLDAGGVNGYADRVVDPRALWILKETGASFGLQVGEAIAPHDTPYEWKPRWLEDTRFVEPLVLAAQALGARAYAFPYDTSPRNQHTSPQNTPSKSTLFEVLKRTLQRPQTGEQGATGT